MAFSVSDAVNMYERITIDVRFFKLASLHNMPVCFTDNRFYYKPESYLFDISDLLKPLVSSDSDETLSAMSPAGDGTTVEKVAQAGSTMQEMEEEKEEIDTCSAKFQEALARLNDCLTDENLAALKRIQQKNLSEEDIVVGIGIHLIQKLSGRAETNKKKSEMKCPCGCSGKLGYGEKMYIGTEETWHGELDLFALGVGVTATTDVEETSGAGDTGYVAADEEGSQGERSNLEFKTYVQQKISGIQQVISQAVVFGWTEHNRHRNLSPFIPSLYIDNREFLVLIYNPVQDTLMIAIHSVKFIEESFPLPAVYSGIFALWIVLNHRLFFKKQIRSGINEVECGFKSQVTIEAYERLDTFKSVVRNTFEGYKFVDRICLKMNYGEQSGEETKKRKRSSSD